MNHKDFDYKFSVVKYYLNNNNSIMLVIKKGIKYLFE